MNTLTELYSDGRLRMSTAARGIQDRLMREFELKEMWQAARLAIAVSLGDPTEPQPPEDRDAREMRGPQLFRNDGAALTALIIVRASRPLDPDAIARLIEAHWDRGIRMLDARLQAAREENKSADDILIELVEASLLAGKAKGQSDFDDPRAALDAVIVGQNAAKEVVVPLLRDALAAKPRMLNASLLFTGPASTGKTLFSSTIAKILGLPFVDTNGPVLVVIEDLLDRIEKACWEQDSKMPSKIGTRGGLDILQFPPALVFIDECHKMNKVLQTELLTVLEAGSREAKTNELIADLSQVTFLLATTDASDLVDPLKTRTRNIRLEEYRREEVAEMIGRWYPRWPSNVHQVLAVAGRLIPRAARIQADDFDRYMRQEQKDRRPSEGLVLEFMKLRGMDSLGLTSTDYAYLANLPASKEPRGLQQIASQLRLEKEEVEEEIEPYLIQLGFVERAQRGRSITDKGLERLTQHRQGSTP